MKKQVLTNILSKIHFTQYGVTKMLEYNGTPKQAKDYLKGAFGINRTISTQQYKRDSYLPVGYCSIESV